MAVTLEELVVKLSADNSDLKRKLDEAEKASKKTTDGISKGFKGAGAWLSRFTANLAANLAAGAFRALGRAAVDLFNIFLTDGVKAAQVQEDAINALNTALKTSGELTKETSLELQAFASELQKTTKFGDETTLSAMALIQSIGQLEKDALKKATIAAADMAVALGVDLKTAANLVGRAATGEIGTLSRYGITVQRGADNTETFANALDAISSKFGGAAAAQINTYSGAVAQLSNSWGDATEITGQAVTDNQSVLNVVKELNTIINELSLELKGAQGSFGVFVKDGIIVALDAVTTFAAAARFVGGAWTVTIEGLTGLILTFGKVFTQVAASIDSSFRGIDKTMGLALKASQEKFAAAFEKGEFETSLVEFTERLKEAAEKGAGAIVAVTDKINEQAAVAIEEMTIMREDAQIEELESLISQQQALAELVDEADAEELVRFQTKIDAKMAKLSKESQDIISIRSKLKDERMKIEDKEEKEADAMRKKKLAAVATLGSNLVQLSQGNSKELFIVGKALGIASATISSYLAFTKALANPPGPPFSYVQAAAALTSGLLQVSKISSTTFTPAVHGIDKVPGIGFKDNFPAVLQPGEAVVRTKANQKLERFLDAELGASDATGRALAGNQGGGQIMEVRFKPEEFMDFIETQLVERQRLDVRVS